MRIEGIFFVELTETWHVRCGIKTRGSDDARFEGSLSEFISMLRNLDECGVKSVLPEHNWNPSIARVEDGVLTVERPSSILEGDVVEITRTETSVLDFECGRIYTVRTTYKVYGCAEGAFNSITADADGIRVAVSSGEVESSLIEGVISFDSYLYLRDKEIPQVQAFFGSLPDPSGQKMTSVDWELRAEAERLAV